MCCIKLIASFVTCVSYAEVCLSYNQDVCHMVVLYQNGLTYCHAFFTTR